MVRYGFVGFEAPPFDISGGFPTLAVQENCTFVPSSITSGKGTGARYGFSAGTEINTSYTSYISLKKTSKTDDGISSPA